MEERRVTHSRPFTLRARYRHWLDAHMREIVHGASWALALKAIGSGLSFALYVALGRLLGAADAGVYFLALTVATGAAVVGRAGLDYTTTRFVAATSARGDAGALGGLFRTILAIVLGGCLAATAVCLGLSGWLGRRAFTEPALVEPLRWMALSIVPIALLNVLGRALQGLKRIWEANLVMAVSAPALSLVAVFLLTPRWGVLGAVWANTLASGTAMALGVYLWRRATPELRSTRGEFSTSRLLQSSIPLWWVSTLQLIIDASSTVVLGAWAAPADVGIFVVANRAAALTSFVLMGVNSISAPKFAALFEQGDLVTLGRIARNSAKLMALAAAPCLLACLLFPAWIMSLFGPQFAAGAPVLVVLALGQYINVATGSVGFLLMMCGYEAAYRNNFVACTILSLLLNALLVPRFGVLGAAVATGTTLAVQNVIAAVLVWRNLGVMTIPFVAAKPRALGVPVSPARSPDS